MASARDELTVRQTKAAGQLSVGAIIMVDDHVLVPCDIRWWGCQGKWFGERIHHVGRIQPIIKDKLEEAKELRRPPVLFKDRGGQTRGDRIPTVRFPKWMRCPRCGLLLKNPWKNNTPEEKPRCPSPGCGSVLLIPIPWIMISEQGGMSDLNWFWLAHREARQKGNLAQRNCADETRLQIIRNDKNRDHVLTLRCMTCQAETSLEGLLSKDFAGERNFSHQPWNPNEIGDPDGASYNPPIVVTLSDSRVYLPEIVSTLTIPPESRVDPNDLRARLLQHRDFGKIETFEFRSPNMKRYLRDMAREMDTDAEALITALKEITAGYGKEIQGQAYATIEDAHASEFEAFQTEFKDMREWETFITRHVSGPWHEEAGRHSDSALCAGLNAAIEQLVIVERLREVQAFLGFRRVSRHGNLVKPDLTGEAPWVPACELFGEGFFIKFNETLMNQWEHLTPVRKRAAMLEKRYENSTVLCNAQPSPRFILLHTLAHLLIREMESVCGYPAASLKERLYCREASGDPATSMAGILIYVAVPDKAGSLGGLTLQGEPRNFLPLVLRTLEKARWCSLDPICREQMGQGPNQLNLAACHSCCLLPETTCQHANVLLDRLLLSGGTQEGPTGFFEWIENAVTCGRTK